MTLRPQRGSIPLATPNALSQIFWEGCRRGELLYQAFDDSSTPQFSPTHRSRVSGSREFTWKTSRGSGIVYSYTVVWRPQTPAFEVPYVVAIVELDEGYHMISNIIGCEPDDVHVGQRVQVEFHVVDDDVALPYFRPADEAVTA
ncbi:Zn-ribbon domain-containing OB-fold protein [Rhodococcus olei]|uniref:Zn-ribbon domain-containing OB-fold protein n=1 Tax=Rhodococcus olei TaxID=2161675 RepID=A0ABP8PTP8_9NOCA